MAVGFRVLKRSRKVDAAWAEKFRRLPAANVSDSMFRMSAGGARLRYHAGGELTNAGIVINGAVRDVGYIRAHGFPVYAAGVTHRGPYKNGPGEINVAVALDGMAIAPGDLVLGDDDGLLCVPYDEVEAVHKLAHEKHEMETKTFQDIGKGDNNRAQYEKTLRGLGCEFEP
jgi:regulator of RNase E activity RraA